VIVHHNKKDIPALIERAHPDLGSSGFSGIPKAVESPIQQWKVLFNGDVHGESPPVCARQFHLRQYDDLDDQIWRTFVGCGMVDPKTTPRASSGAELKEILEKNYSFVFTLIHKFNQPVDPKEPDSLRDDSIVISDEAHRTQAGRFARNMRLAFLSLRHAEMDNGLNLAAPTIANRPGG
jgi:type I restriction enzyme, R subunit